MANTRELRRRIKSVKNTAQITKAMEMVSATKMRRAQSQALSGRPYSFTLSESLARLAGKVDPSKNKLLQPNDATKVGVILLTTDKPLCGALNTNVLRALNQFLNSSPITHNSSLFYTVGKKGRNFVVKTGKGLVADFENSDLVTFRQAKQLAKLVVDAFLKEEIKESYIIYPNFISTLRQEPTVMKLLPVDSSVVIPGSVATPESRSAKMAHVDSGQAGMTYGANEFLFEPSPDALLDFILTHHIETQIYQALLETKASEHSARMIAMQNASNNAKDLVSDLNLTYNQTRQDAITRELLEITTAALALE